MHKLGRILSLCALAAAIRLSDARAASVTVTGTDGASVTTQPPAQTNASGIAGQTGQDGAAANAVATGPDADNSATAIGGNGGAGGPGGDVTQPSQPVYVGGPGGDGGTGGAATAQAGTNVAGDTTAAASAKGGSGGGGGLEGTPPLSSFLSGAGPRNGLAGAAGAADARSTATSQVGAATATSDANGSAANAQSNATSLAGSADATSNAAGAASSSVSAAATASGEGTVHSAATSTGGRDSTATASAQSGSADATSQAQATGLGPAPVLATATSISSTDAHASAQANAAGPAAPAESHASALSHRGDAFANAIARPGGSAYFGQAAGTPTVSADATSETGNATAQVQASAGDGVPPVVDHPERISGSVTPGGPGDSLVLVDAVHGSAPGKLSLVQQANGGGAGGGSGGTGDSELHAENPGGGALFAEAIGQGGGGASVPYPRRLTTYGGNAIASVVASDTHGAAVEAHAFAWAGTGSTEFFTSTFGSAESHATAQGPGSLIARADSRSGGDRLATSEVIGTGAVRGAQAQLSGNAALQVYGYADLHAETRMLAAAGVDGAQIPSGTPGTQANLFAAPRTADVNLWTAGNPHTLDALAGRTALALGSLAGTPTGYPTPAGPVSGSVSLDLDAASFGPGTALTVAFLDPVDSGVLLDLLHLQMSVDGNQVFDESFQDSASALAALDDKVVELGSLGPATGALRHFVLAFELQFASGSLPSGFATDFVVFAPEPAASALLGLALLGLWHRSRRSPS
jgi:hypothetical protein